MNTSISLTTSSSSTTHSLKNFWIGFSLAVTSSIFIGSSFILKKKALLRLSLAESAIRASQGGYGYLRDWLWWTGVIAMGLGEALNFAAYMFAPATLVTPLGALSVLVTTVLSSKLLKERLNLLGKIGCLICILGSIVVVIHSPKEENIESMQVLAERVKSVGFALYVAMVALVTAFLILYAGPRWGDKFILIYIFICSLIGSLSVLGVKGIGLAIKETLGGHNQFTNWLTYFWIGSLLFCVSVQLNYLNKSLDVFNTAMVTPIYYVFFTTFVILSSGVLFEEFKNISRVDLLGIIVGFSCTVTGIFQMQLFKNFNVTWKQLKHMMATSKLSNSERQINFHENFAPIVERPSQSSGNGWTKSDQAQLIQGEWVYSSREKRNRPTNDTWQNLLVGLSSRAQTSRSACTRLL